MSCHNNSLQIITVFLLVFDFNLLFSIIQFDQHMLDFQSLNPSWDLARKHGQASAPGITTKQITSKQDPVCPCCMNQINKSQVPLCQNSKSLQFLGYGFPLYYIFIKYSLILLLMLIITYTSIGMYWGVKHNQNFCVKHEERRLPNGEQPHCSSWMVRYARTELQVTQDENIVRITSFAVQLLILLYIRDILMKTNQYYDEREISPSDFSILVQNLPKKGGVAKILKNLLQDKSVFKKSHNIQSIVYLSELDKYFDLKKQKKKLVESLKAALEEQAKDQQNRSMGDKIKQIQADIYKTKIQIKSQEDKEREAIQSDTVECQKLILIFNTEMEKEEVIEDYAMANKTIIQTYFGKHNSTVQFKEAPQPREILWENINVPRARHVRRVIISWVGYLLLLGTVTLVFFYLMSLKTLQVQHSTEGEQSPVVGAFMVYASLFLILLFNKFILSKISHKLTDYQKQKTGGDLEWSFAIKNVLGLFFTTAIMTLLVEDIKFHNIYTHDYGVIQEESIMFFFNGFLAPLIWLINPWHIYHILRKRYYEGDKLLTQEQANKVMQKTNYSIGKRYSQVIEGIWFTFLYASLIPIGSCLTFVGLAMFYWIDKYNLLRKSSVLENVSSHIGLQAMTLLDFTLILRPLGQIIFDSQIRGGIVDSSVICLVIGFVYIALPMNKILDAVHPEDFDLADQTYSETKDYFLFNYYTLHPLRQSSQRLKTLKTLQQTNILQTEHQQLKLTEGRFVVNEQGFIKQERKEKSKVNCLTSSRNMFQQSMDSCQLNEINSNDIVSGTGLIRGLKNLPPLRESRRKFNLSKLG